MEYLVILLSVLVLALAVAVVVVWYRSRLKVEAMRHETDVQSMQVQALREQMERMEQDAAKRVAEAKNEANGNIQLVRQECERRIETLKAEHRDDTERQQRLWKETMETNVNLAREEMRSQFEREMKERANALKQENREQMEHIMSPMNRELKRLQELMDRTSTEQTEHISTLKAGIQAVVQHDKERDKTTQDLAAALKNRGKVHGDWGEQVLENILRDSGLREGHEYKKQVNVRSEDGTNLRPDVVVYASDGSRLVIDSKVSLTAYADYVGAETEEERQKAIKANRESLWNHVKELSGTQYQQEVKDAIPIVLMFVPNEGSYVLAMNYDPQLGIKAFNEGVIIINPTNLMVVLHLVLLSWQNVRQDKNVSDIMKAVRGIYEKYVSFAKTFVSLGRQINTAKSTYETGLGQLREGRENLSDRMQGLLRLGVTPTKTLPEEVLPLDDSEPYDDVDIVH